MKKMRRIYLNKFVKLSDNIVRSVDYNNVSIICGYFKEEPFIIYLYDDMVKIVKSDKNFSILNQYIYIVYDNHKNSLSNEEILKIMNGASFISCNSCY